MIDLSTLRRIPLFRDFNDEQLSQVLATVSERRLPKHQFVVREGEPGDTFFVIASGSVAVVRVGPDGRETILSILKEGDFFGEMSMFDSSLPIRRKWCVNAAIEEMTLSGSRWVCTITASGYSASSVSKVPIASRSRCFARATASGRTPYMRFTTGTIAG